MGKKPIILKAGDTLVLCQYTAEYAPVIFALIDRCRPHLSQNGDTTATKYPTLESVLLSIEHPENPKRLRFGIWDSGTLVGSINIEPTGNGCAELGYWLGEPFLGKGYATRAARRLIQEIFTKNINVTHITAKVRMTNTDSLAVLERLHFERIGREKADLLFHLQRWLPFYLDTSFISEWITSKRRWNEVVTQKFNGNIETLKAMRFRSPSVRDGLPDFGQGPYHQYSPTLGQWAERNGINLEIT